jgi:FAD/FMN-containing dehydrogenase
MNDTNEYAHRPLIWDQLRRVVGDDHVITDQAECQFFSSDVYSAGTTCACVIAPGTTEELARAVQTATEQGYAVVPRGGGMSYTGGYLPVRPDTVIMDLRRLNRVRELNLEAMYVTVEAGTTWKQLYEALKPHGVRTAFFGTLSGIHATVGGALSQGGMFFGSGRHGAAPDSVLGLEVVLADGTIVPTGQAAHRNAKPFFRWYGPDLTGMFLCDTGAMGFKTAATLRLVRTPKGIAYGSFAFEEMEPCVRAMAEIAREELAIECFGFDPVLQAMRMKRESLMKDIKTFTNVVTGQGSVMKGLKEGAKMALAGRGFMDDVKWSFHVTCEGRSEAAAAADLDAIRAIVKAHGGREIENTIPKAIRAYPFTPLNNMIGPSGERWLPVHGILNLADVVPIIQNTQAMFAQHGAEVARHGIEIGMMIATVSNHAFIFEPVFFWPDQWTEVQKRTAEPAHLAKLSQSPPRPDATAAVHRIKTELVKLLAESGAAHFQIGKTYLWREHRDPAALALIEKWKSMVDPQRLVNPQSLGLE